MKRITASISDELHQKIKELAEKEKRSFSQMVEILLEYSLREKTRKR